MVQPANNNKIMPICFSPTPFSKYWRIRCIDLKMRGRSVKSPCTCYNRLNKERFSMVSKSTTVTLGQYFLAMARLYGIIALRDVFGLSTNTTTILLRRIRFWHLQSLNLRSQNIIASLIRMTYSTNLLTGCP